VLAANDSNLFTCALRPISSGGRGPASHPSITSPRSCRPASPRGSGQNLIDAVYVENAATAHLLAAERLKAGSPVGGKAYFITNGEPVNCWDWINAILTLAGAEPVAKSISYRARLRRRSRAGRNLETDRPHRRTPPDPLPRRPTRHQHYFNITAARRDLGYEPAISMSAGMERLRGAL